MPDDLDGLAADLQRRILSEARTRYTAAVIDHWRRPRNRGVVCAPDGYATVTGPCGDTMEISFRERKGRVAECRFVTDGCGAAIACGSVATGLLTGKTLDAARRLTEDNILQTLGGLPESDIHCAVLAAGTVRAAVRDYDQRSRQPSAGQADRKLEEVSRG